LFGGLAPPCAAEKQRGDDELASEHFRRVRLRAADFYASLKWGSLTSRPKNRQIEPNGAGCEFALRGI
jgi:hypothetical protein